MATRRFLAVSENREREKALAAIVADAGELALASPEESAILAEVGRRAHAAIFLDADCRGAAALPLCRRLRALLPASACALILFGSPRGPEKVVAGLDEGADDFWPYPFNAPVCRAYLRAILRRVSRGGAAGEAVKAGKLLLDPKSRRASLGGADLPLRSKEFDLLYLLVLKKGEVLSREFLMETAWGTEYFGTTRTIDFHVSQLRRKLGELGSAIKTAAGAGYRFAPK